MAKYIVGLTGGIGSGKTTVGNIFADLGVDIIDADIVAREIVAPKSETLAMIAQHFGAQFITPEGELDRAMLRERVFSHEDDKLWLNNLLHPRIRTEISRQLSNASSSYVILVAPLLLENGLDKSVNRVLVVDLAEQMQVERTTKRDKNTPQQIKNIMASQLTREARLNSADDIVDNNANNIAHLDKQVNQLHQQYLALAGR